MASYKYKPPSKRKRAAMTEYAKACAALAKAVRAADAKVEELFHALKTKEEAKARYTVADKKLRKFAFTG